MQEEKECFSKLSKLVASATTNTSRYKRYETLKTGLSIYLANLDTVVHETRAIALLDLDTAADTTFICSGYESLKLNHVSNLAFKPYFRRNEVEGEIIDYILKKFDSNDRTLNVDGTYFQEESLDDLISDDVLTVWAHDFQYLKSITTPNRLFKMLQRIGTEFHLEKGQKKDKILHQFILLNWSDEQHISQFIKQYDQIIRLCHEVNLFKHKEEQRAFFIYKVSRNRRENFAIFNALQKLEEVNDETSLMSFMLIFSNTIVAKYPSGIVPRSEN